jgi:hypothetical protein
MVFLTVSPDGRDAFRFPLDCPVVGTTAANDWIAGSEGVKSRPRVEVCGVCEDALEVITVAADAGGGLIARHFSLSKIHRSRNTRLMSDREEMSSSSSRNPCTYKIANHTRHENHNLVNKAIPANVPHLDLLSSRGVLPAPRAQPRFRAGVDLSPSSWRGKDSP